MPGPSEDKEAQFYWLQFSYIFQWPHITYFDDFKDLEHKLQQVNFNKIHKRMVEEVESSKRARSETWYKLIQTVYRKKRFVLKSYQSKNVH